MSRYYRMDIEISDYHDKKSKIIEIANEAWPDFESNWNEFDKELISSGEGNLSGGLLEDDFAKSLNDNISEIGHTGKVTIGCTSLEDIPTDYFHFDNKKNKK